MSLSKKIFDAWLFSDICGKWLYKKIYGKYNSINDIEKLKVELVLAEVRKMNNNLLDLKNIFAILSIVIVVHFNIINTIKDIIKDIDTIYTSHVLYVFFIFIVFMLIAIGLIFIANCDNMKVEVLKKIIEERQQKKK